MLKDIRTAPSVSDVVDAAESAVRDVARGHAPKDVCSMCTEDTPLSYAWASDVSKASEYEKIVDTTEKSLADLGETDTWWVDGELSDAYFEAYHAACADPDDCVVCNKQIISDDEQCGHERMGETCPSTP